MVNKTYREKFRDVYDKEYNKYSGPKWLTL